MKRTHLFQPLNVIKIILPALCILLSFDIARNIGETHIKTMTDLHYNWAVFRRRVGAFIAFSLILGAIGYTVALIIESIVQLCKR